jgi:ferredoxin
VFAGGDVWRKRKTVIRSLADGKEAAVSIAQFLRGDPVTGPKRPFNSRMGKLDPEELAELADSAGASNRVEALGGDHGLVEERASREAERCLHCDCRRPASCKLRIYADAYGAKAARYRGRRRPFTREVGNSDLTFEPGKCIDCGICVRITEQQREKLGLTFVGRGFDVQVSVPFNQAIEAGLTSTAHEVVVACPTGALAFVDDPETLESQAED